jgi:serine phosphatase RsbU (regulator of sigma subunit)
MTNLVFKDATGIILFDIGLVLAFGVLHLLLYLFYPRQRANLFFSFFAFSAVLRLTTADLLDLDRAPSAEAYFISYLGVASIGLAVFSFVAFLSKAFEERFPVHFYLTVAVWTGGVLASLLGERQFFLRSTSLLIIAFVAIESLRIIGRALFARRDGAWIVGLGVLFLIVSPVQNGIVIALQTDISHTLNLINTQISLCGIMVANSVFLARSFARTNHDLEKQIIQVTELSAKEIEHIRTAAELRLENEQEQAKRALVEQELQLAADIQLALFPERLPGIEGFDVSAFNRAARECGGDYYDVLKLEKSGSYLFCVADVSGKGIPAALLMSNMQATLRALADQTPTLTELALKTSELLYATSPSNRFVTAILIEIDASTGKARYVNAGHNECLLLRASGETEILRSTGFALGMLEGMPYEEESIEIRSGDLIALYSDGVPEAYNEKEEEWGEQNLEQCLQEFRESDAAAISELVITEIDRFAGSAAQHDDITLMIIRRLVS